MAGIGFELHRILYKGTLGSIFKAFLLGAIIVAGPWILSVISIYLIQKYAALAISENPVMFTVTIVYVYAFSLIFYGGLHYVFSRYIADMMYIEDDDAIPPALLTVFLIVIITSLIIMLIFIFFNDFSFLQFSLLYKISLIFLFITINLIWLMLIYVALLKEYYKIFFAYLIGSLGSVFGVLFLGKMLGVAGAILGYASGQFLIVILLILISLKAYPMTLKRINFQVFTYFTEFKYLLMIGIFFNLSIWSDKIYYWIKKGVNIKHTFFYYYMPYDIPVFLAFLSMIPGLVYFLVVSEPIFHRVYFRFVKNIMHDTLKDIKSNKAALIRNFKKGISQLILFQGVWTIGCLINTKGFLAFMGYTYIDIVVMRILFLAVFFHMCALLLQLYLLYLEFRKAALFGAIFYFILNVSLAIIMPFYGVDIPGLSYLISAFVTAVFSWIYISVHINSIDYIIFNRM